MSMEQCTAAIADVCRHQNVTVQNLIDWYDLDRQQAEHIIAASRDDHQASGDWYRIVVDQFENHVCNDCDTPILAYDQYAHQWKPSASTRLCMDCVTTQVKLGQLTEYGGRFQETR
jgi:hypothetical protein